ncbi:NADH dehydrogenase [ubiquinone] 1 beta subcomplex subunit 3 [Frankliniella occidentalis]|uniref:NADH dehydrogenase [ubiquinone] 1 beta subcomplex subunit 3 n=1 Tax=Frankliniella occidentalis TaxID=133901 RepID=A0A6J1TKW1_FRAOC|nr:NADH dehydrogenase [ubiquinone] 1 beta subcomplex subunit 3 [Frankliniella occidentalis]
MGGDHHHHGPPYKVPDYRTYKVDENSPELLQIQRALAAQGLKDPWLRNEVWRYNRQLIGPQNWSTTWGRIMFRKFPVGLALAAGTVALEMAYDSYNGSGDHGHGHGEHH